MNLPPPLPPPPPPPQPVPPQQIILPPQGMGCFARGCLTVLVVGFLLIAGVIAGGWFILSKTINNLTSTAPADVRIEQPSEAQFQAAEKSLAQVNQAIANNQETTVEFTSADLNALLARDEDFKDLRGRARIEIADSMITIALSVPLDYIRWRRLKRRWFNGTARFGLAYSSGQFRLDLESAEAGGHHLPGRLLSGTFMSSLNDGLNESFQEWLRGDGTEENFWKHVKTVSLAGDKMVVTTKAR
ncbi:MAG TPA: hypothetical protein VK581_05110 [Chthoniobacterales bacterium]|nr:hypothetical protein [Chthoniobacterales bacterium]